MTRDHDPKQQPDYSWVKAREDFSLQAAFSHFRCEARVALEARNQAFEEFEKNRDGRKLFSVDSIKQHKG